MRDTFFPRKHPELIDDVMEFSHTIIGLEIERYKISLKKLKIDELRRKYLSDLGLNESMIKSKSRINMIGLLVQHFIMDRNGDTGDSEAFLEKAIPLVLPPVSISGAKRKS